MYRSVPGSGKWPSLEGQVNVPPVAFVVVEGVFIVVVDCPEMFNFVAMKLANE